MCCCPVCPACAAWPAQRGTLVLSVQQCNEWAVVPLLQTPPALQERSSRARPTSACRCHARLRAYTTPCCPQCSAHAGWPRQLSFTAHVTQCTEQRAVALQAQPATQELPSWAQTNFSLPMASEAARSRHALLPTMSSARRVTPASTASMGPLYPSFDSSPIAPIDYGPAHAAQQAAQQQALPPPPSAPPLPQHVRPPCSPPTLGKLFVLLLGPPVPQLWHLVIGLIGAVWQHELGALGAVIALRLVKAAETQSASVLLAASFVGCS